MKTHFCCHNNFNRDKNTNNLVQDNKFKKEISLKQTF